MKATICDHCGTHFWGRSSAQRFCSAEHRRLGYWSPTLSERARLANARKSRLPCSVRGCLQARYVGPAGDARSRCPEHEATAARERYAAAHPAYRPRFAGRGSRLAAS